jgi:hypothetical protein
MLELALSEVRAAAGDVVHGRVYTQDELTPLAVDLVRTERSPTGFASYRVASAQLAGDGSFTLIVPDDAPPDVVGRDCSLHYSLRALSKDEEVRQPFSVAP